MQGAAHFIHQQMGCNTFLKHLCAPPGHHQHLSAPDLELEEWTNLHLDLSIQ